MYRTLLFAIIISKSAGSAIVLSAWGHLAHSVSFKMTSAGWMPPITGAPSEGLSYPLSPLALWMDKCSSCIPCGRTLMSALCQSMTSLSQPDPAVLLKETVNRTWCLCVSCPLYVCASQCANVFCCSFLTHCPAKGLPSQAAVPFLSKTIWVTPSETEKRVPSRLVVGHGV